MKVKGKDSKRFDFELARGEELRYGWPDSLFGYSEMVGCLALEDVKVLR